MLTALRLPLQFDREALAADLRRVRPEEWARHYNRDDFGGEWRGAALRSASAAATDLYAAREAYRDTPLLERCGYLREVLSLFRCPLRGVRLLSLAPGSFIREHADNALDFEDGEVRIHVPVQTSVDVEFYLAGERLLLEEGGTYYLNVNLPHRVNNRGACDRVHLVIDAEVDEWVREVFDRGEPIPRSTRPPRGAAELHARVFRDPAWQDRLRGIAAPREFEREAVRLAKEAGLDLHEGDIGAALGASPAEALPEWRPSRDWMPVRFFVRDGAPRAEWICTEGRRFTEPFFEDSVRACLREPFARFSRCEAPLEDTGAREPSGFVYHMSRCGSTLLAQMFAALPRLTVISEAPPIDQAVQGGNAEWLRRTVLAMGGGKPFLVKLDAWHIHALPLIREAFPAVPWVFVFRDPAEVLQSHLRGPGRHCVPGMVDAAALRVDPAECPVWDLAGWAARVIAAICRSAVAARGEPGGMFVDYAELPQAANRIAAHFGIPLDDDAQARMVARSGFDAKNFGIPFYPSGAAMEGVGVLVREFGLDALYRQIVSANN